MTVVNDSVERAIALIRQYNAALTKKEDQKYFIILHLVQNHIKKHPSCSKATLAKTID